MPMPNNGKPYILVSACLLGSKTRFDGTSKDFPAAKELAEYYNIIPICPELDSGMSLPRDPSEIKDGRVYSKKGIDVTDFYLKGAQLALKSAQKYHVRLAVLKDRSPSCGSAYIHTGNFDGQVKPGQGFTAELLRQNGINVISEDMIEKLLESNRQKDEEEEK
jgi:uncharacterized protein YbbK (DUF523 family)